MTYIYIYMYNIYIYIEISLHLYLRCFLYIGSSGEQKKVLNLLFDEEISARSKVLLFQGHTPTCSVLFTEDLYRYAYTIIQYTYIH